MQCSSLMSDKNWAPCSSTCILSLQDLISESTVPNFWSNSFSLSAIESSLPIVCWIMLNLTHKSFSINYIGDGHCGGGSGLVNELWYCWSSWRGCPGYDTLGVLDCTGVFWLNPWLTEWFMFVYWCVLTEWFMFWSWLIVGELLLS